MSSLSETSRQLKAEAEQIVRRLRLVECLAQYGDAEVVGSIALDLVVKRDIDIHVVVEPGKLLSVCDEVCSGWRQLCPETNVHCGDYRDCGGIKVGVDSFAGPSGPWSIDIWITDNPTITGFALLHDLKGRLSPQMREAILEIKAHYNALGMLRNGLSRRIYYAVADHGVLTLEDFERFAASDKAGRQPGDGQPLG